MHYPFPGDITVETFLRDYWQKKPLLIRNAFPDIKSPLSADELAGLACEPDANARLIFEEHQHGNWYVQHGPLYEEDFSNLPEKDWTLLVTDVEKHSAEARELINHFRFIPDWRIDDLMISYAAEGGSVGPHTDAYDVFLIQVEGQRHWMVNTEYDETCVEDTELRILKNFNSAEDWILEPGDMLYLPPHVAHHGIAVNGPCMTCSAGFRSPSISNLVSEYAETLAADIDPELRYEDPDLDCQLHPAEIPPAAINNIKALLLEQLQVHDDLLQRWFGRYSTEPRAGVHPHYPDRLFDDFDDLVSVLNSSTAIAQSRASKFLFMQSDDSTLLFVDGECYKTSLNFAIAITDQRTFSPATLLNAAQTADDQQVLLHLYNNGNIIIVDEA